MAEFTAGNVPRDILRLVIRLRLLFFVCFAVMVIGVFQYGKTRPKQYTSTAVFRREQTSEAEQERARTVSFEAIKATLIEDLKDPKAIEKVVTELGLTQGFQRDESGQLTERGSRDEQNLINKIRNGVHVEFKVKSKGVDQVAVSYTSTDKTLAKDIPNELVKNYIGDINKKITAQLSKSLGYLDDQIKGKNGAEKRVENLRAQKAKMDNECPGITVEPTLESINRIQEAASRLQGLKIELISAEDNRKQLAKARNEAEEARKNNTNQELVEVIMGPNPDLQRLTLQLQTLQDKVEEAKSLYHMTERHPEVIALNQSIKLLEARIQKTPVEVELNKLYKQGQGMESFAAMIAEADARIRQLTTQIKVAQGRLEGYEKQQQKFNSLRSDYAKLINEIDDAERDLNQLQDRRRNVEQMLNAERKSRRTMLEIKQMAQDQKIPSSPKLKTITLMAFGLGLGLAGGLVFVMHKLTRSFTSVENAREYFDVPIQGVISPIQTSSVRYWRRLRWWVFEPLLGLMLIAGVALSYFTFKLWLENPEDYQRWLASPIDYGMEWLQYKFGI